MRVTNSVKFGVTSRVYSSPTIAELSWIVLTLFMLLERLSYTFVFSIPKIVTLGIKYFAVFLLICAATQKIFGKKTKILKFTRPLTSFAFLIGLITFFQNQGQDLFRDSQESIAWLIIGLIAFLKDQFSLKFISGFLKFTTAYSACSLTFGPNAFTKDFRLSLFGLDTRLVGFFGHPNMTALFSSVFLLLCLHLKLSKKWFVLNALILVLTFSNTAVFSLILLSLAVFITKNASVKLIALSTSSLLLITNYVPFLISSRIQVADDLSFMSNRGAIWSWTVKRLTLNDYKAMPELFSNNFESQNIFFIHAHNQFLMDLVQGGFLKALTVQMFVVFFVYMSFYSAKFFGNPYLLVYSLILVLNQLTEIPLYLNKIDSRSLFLSLVIVVILNGAWRSDLRDSFIREVSKPND